MKLFIACLFVLVAAVTCRPKSDCEKHRDGIEGHETIMKLIPKCKENGDYEALQCYEDSNFCVCYNPKGHAVSPISSKLRTCECYQRRYDKIQLDIDDSYIPQCDAEGTFSKMQCWEAKKWCWCVDENNDQVGTGFDIDKPREC